jgi:pimeloyl-ACP methyl ester carboxylesterase
MNNRNWLCPAFFALLTLGCAALSRAEDGASAPVPASPTTGLAGSWLGALDVGAVKLRLALNVRDLDGKRVATIDSIDQGAKGLPVSMITETEGSVRLELKNIGAVFEGTYRADGAELAGTWTQGGQPLPLVFRRQEKPFALSRPQVPTKPYPYREEDVTFRNERADITLAGTLTLPPGEGPFAAVVLISGSGPQDRDESLMGHKPFLVLADHLTRAGIAVLRYDDRGVARSKGNHAKATHVDFASDARAAFEFLRTRAGIDPKRIGLLGHSEGSIHAPLAAADAQDVAFIVFLAGVGVPMNELLERQTIDLLKLRGIDYAISPAERAIRDAMNERMRTLPDDPETPAFIRAKLQEGFALMSDDMKRLLGVNETMIESQTQMMLSPWFMRLAIYDPRPALIKLRCPLLALNGDKDSQVAADENLAGIKAALEAGGNNDVTVRKFPGLNHLFQHSTTGAPSEYGTIEETMSPEVLAVVAEWILAKTTPTAR